MLKNEHDPRGRSGFLAVSILETAPDPAAHPRRVRPRLAGGPPAAAEGRGPDPSRSAPPSGWSTRPSTSTSTCARRRCPPPAGCASCSTWRSRSSPSRSTSIARCGSSTSSTGLREVGEAAVLMKTHHAVMDGMAAVELFKQVFDFTPEGDPDRCRPGAGPRTGDHLRRRPDPRRGAAAARHRAGRCRAPDDRCRRHRDEVRPGARSRPTGEAADLLRSARRMFGGPPAPPSPLLRDRSAGRRFEVVDFDLEDLRAVAKAAGGSVNDAYLAGVCARAAPLPRGARLAGRRAAAGPADQHPHRGRPRRWQPLRRRHHRRARGRAWIPSSASGGSARSSGLRRPNRPSPP